MKRTFDTGKKLASTGISIVAFAVLTALSVVIFRELAERDRLESRNDAERTMNLLFADLRDHDDFGSAIESMESLRRKVIGVAAYSAEGKRIYAWGANPDTLTPPSRNDGQFGSSVQLYLDRPENDSIALLFHPFRSGGPPPPPPPPDRQADAAQGSAGSKGGDRNRSSSFLFTTLRHAEIVYLEIKEPEYWRNKRIDSILFPIIEVALAALIIFVRTILTRNVEYRRRIEEQESLVLLGTAASTLAHEIKNPLLSIRLQTRILEKTYPSGARREIEIINDEVERLSSLSHRVGDYLRDPAGNPKPIDPAEIALEVGLRLCGRNILRLANAPPPRVSIDPERLRSVLENLLRNAIEAGGPEEGVSLEVGAEADRARIDILDRGSGLSSEAKARLFDPFFTTKSRGTGIGLSICKRFITAAGGSISLENRPGGGCRARVLLPGTEASP
jgi:two-component system sensor histidine kinase HydH